MLHPFDIIMVPMQIVIFLFTLYFFVIGFCGMWRKKEEKILVPKSTFAVIVAAHNESAVIGQLVDNLRNLNYPKDLYDIYVIADNCSEPRRARALPWNGCSTSSSRWRSSMTAL